MSLSTSSSLSAPFSMSVVSSRSRSASVDHRSTTISIVLAPLRPTLLMLTANAVKRSGVPWVCARVSVEAAARPVVSTAATAAWRIDALELMTASRVGVSEQSCANRLPAFALLADPVAAEPQPEDFSHAGRRKPCIVRTGHLDPPTRRRHGERHDQAFGAGKGVWVHSRRGWPGVVFPPQLGAGWQLRGSRRRPAREL